MAVRTPSETIGHPVDDRTDTIANEIIEEAESLFGLQVTCRDYDPDQHSHWLTFEEEYVVGDIPVVRLCGTLVLEIEIAPAEREICVTFSGGEYIDLTKFDKFNIVETSALQLWPSVDISNVVVF
jgi:hypothetical protein